jgi:hypothetical protein
MDRGTDPMDLSESTPLGLRSGTQSHSQTERGRLLMHDSSSGGAGSGSGSTVTTTTTATTSRNNDNSSRLGTSDGPSALPRNVLQRTADFNTVESVFEQEDMLSRSGAEHHDIARSASSLTGHGPPQESGEQTAVPSSSATDTERRRNLAEEQQILPESITGPADNRNRVQITYGLRPTRPLLPTYTSVTYARRYHQNQDSVVILSLLFLH